MGTITAQLLIGHGHPNEDGIIPAAQMDLAEGDRPAWILVPRDRALARHPDEACAQKVWIPSEPGHILEDGLLMLTLCVWRQPELRHEACHLFDPELLRLDLTEVDKHRLGALRDAARGLYWPGKIVLSILTGSTLLSQWKLLESWSVQAEVCTPEWSRIGNQWQKVPAVEKRLSASTGRSVK